jgi:hypothetical protein
MSHVGEQEDGKYILVGCNKTRAGEYRLILPELTSLCPNILIA